MIRIGLMRSMVNIEASTEERSELGKRITWAPLYKNIRCRKVRNKGDESNQRSGAVSLVYWTIRMRYVTGVTSDCRIVENDTVMEIVSVENVDNRSRELVLEVVERGRRQL